VKPRRDVTISSAPVSNPELEPQFQILTPLTPYTLNKPSGLDATVWKDTFAESPGISVGSLAFHPEDFQEGRRGITVRLIKMQNSVVG
jgi:hypothetical protein